MNRAIIFDFDGVLRSVSWHGLMAAYREIIKAKGKKPEDFFTSLETFKAWFDTDWHKNIEKIDGVFLDDAGMNALFHKHYDPYVGLFPWTKEVLKRFSKKQYLAILSSSSIHSVREELGKADKFFDLIVGSETVARLKPHPEGVEYILRRFGLAAANAIVIGDTPQDYHAGKSAGTWTGLVKWGLTDWGTLRGLNAEFYFEHPQELFQLL